MATMRAWQFDAIATKMEDSLILNESASAPDRSSLGVNELLIEVLTAALNPADFKIPESPLVGRLMTRRPQTPGMDFCGRVAAKHPDNHAFQEGQLVFGGLKNGPRFGALGEFLVADNAEVVPLPEGISVDSAAAVGTAATTAYQSLLPAVGKAGWKVFINGGSGGVGTWTIQFAKALGLHVTTSCSTSNVDQCKRLGADEVIDYTATDLIQTLTSGGQVFDIIIDNVGFESLYSSRAMYLKPGGWFMQVGMTMSDLGRIILRTVCSSLPGLDQRKYVFVKQDNSAKYFEQIATWLVEGRVRSIIADTFEFGDVPAAYSRLRQGRARGKVIVHVHA
ncbi:zinc-binding oxidoreductase [Thozetella sp. PMI_491]|nr:zinc-binding oxidoreductase [Thozetella sp. PMI_491]